MSIGILSENLSMPSFMTLTILVLSAAATVALMVGVYGVALL